MPPPTAILRWWRKQKSSLLPTFFCQTHSHPLLFRFLFLALLPSCLLSLRCFECFDHHQPCTRLSNCTGSACVLYEHTLNRTSLAFCLLATAERQDTQMAQGCWRDQDSGGLECVCTTDFCNQPRDLWTADPNSPPVPGLRMLDKNPFVDYEYLEDEKAIQQESGQKEGGSTKEADLTALEDPELPAEGQEQDLMPKEFDEYLDWEQRVRGRNLTPKEDEETKASNSPGQPKSSSASTSANATEDQLAAAAGNVSNSQIEIRPSEDISNNDNNSSPSASTSSSCHLARSSVFCWLLGTLVFLLFIL